MSAPQNLAALLDSKGTPSEPVARRILKEVAEQLWAAHEAGQAHVNVALDQVILGPRAVMTAEWRKADPTTLEANRNGFLAIAQRLGLWLGRTGAGDLRSMLEELEARDEATDANVEAPRTGDPPGRRPPVDLLLLGEVMGAPEEDLASDEDLPLGLAGTEVLEVGDVDPAKSTFEAWTGETEDPETDPASMRPQLGPYRIERRLASGSYSEVYLATNIESGVRVAIKVLRPKRRADPHAQRRLLRELSTLSALRHPNIVALLGTGRGPDFTFVVLEYIEGSSLGELLEREGALRLSEALQIAEQLAEGLGHAHSLGVVHRDLKPSNVMLSAQSWGVQVKIVDFGLVRLLRASEETKLTALGPVGTPGFLAPEQVDGGDVGPAADLYALGVIIHQMISGRLPFMGSVSEVLRMKLDRTAPRLDTLPALDALTAELLDRDPSRRPRSAKEVAERLRTMRANAPRDERGRVPETITAPLAKRGRPVARPWGGPRLWALLLVLSSAGLGYVLGTRGRPSSDLDPRVAEPDRPTAIPELKPRVERVVLSALPSTTTTSARLEPDPTPSAGRTPASPARVRPKIVRGLEVRELERRVRSVLAKKGLLPRDLTLLERSGFPAELGELLGGTSRKQRVDPDRARDLLDELERFRADGRTLQGKLDRILASIRRKAEGAPEDRLAALSALEDRYFRLRERAMRGLEGVALRDALESSSELERDLELTDRSEAR